MGNQVNFFGDGGKHYSLQEQLVISWFSFIGGDFCFVFLSMRKSWTNVQAWCAAKIHKFEFTEQTKIIAPTVLAVKWDIG